MRETEELYVLAAFQTLRPSISVTFALSTTVQHLHLNVLCLRENAAQNNNGWLVCYRNLNSILCVFDVKRNYEKTDKWVFQYNLKPNGSSVLDVFWKDFKLLGQSNDVSYLSGK